MEILRAIISAFRRMPNGVRFVTALSMMFTVFLPVPILPVGEHFVDGDRVAFAEFWRSGGGFLFAFIGIAAIVLAYGLVRARRWARHLVVGLSWSLVVITVFGWRRFSLDVVAAFLMFGCLPTWYFYFRPPVRKYFGFTHESIVT
jgi:hypothetical protein